MDLASFPINKGSAAERQPRLNFKFKPGCFEKTLKKGIVIFESGLNFQLIFKIVKCFFPWGLHAADKPCILHLIHSRS